MRRNRLGCARYGCSVELRAQFCESCGRDGDSFASAGISIHACPRCGVASCSDCWNGVDGACLRCAPFRLLDSSSPPAVISPRKPNPAARIGDGHEIVGPKGDPPVMTRKVPSTRQARAGLSDRGSHAQKAAPRERPAKPRVAITDRVDGRIGRALPIRPIGVAASCAWVLVAALAVAALGTSAIHPAQRVGPLGSPVPSPAGAKLIPESPWAISAPSRGTTPTAKGDTGQDGGMPPTTQAGPEGSGSGSSWLVVAPTPRAGGSPAASLPAVATPPPGPEGTPNPSPTQGWVPGPTPVEPPRTTPAPAPLPTPAPTAAPTATFAPTPTPTEVPTDTPAPTDTPPDSPLPS